MPADQERLIFAILAMIIIPMLFDDARYDDDHAGEPRDDHAGDDDEGGGDQEMIEDFGRKVRPEPAP